MPSWLMVSADGPRAIQPAPAGCSYTLNIVYQFTITHLTLIA
jgi:hypothetical protein